VKRTKDKKVNKILDHQICPVSIWKTVVCWFQIPQVFFSNMGILVHGMDKKTTNLIGLPIISIIVVKAINI